MVRCVLRTDLCQHTWNPIYNEQVSRVSPTPPDLIDLLRQTILVLFVGVAGLFPSHVVHPLLIPVQAPLPTALPDADLGPLGRQVEPRKRVADRADLIRHAGPCLVAHLLVQLVVREQVDQVLRDGRPVSRLDQEPVDVGLHLQRDAAGVGDDHGTTRVQRLRDLDLEPFAGRQLKDHMCVGDDRVRICPLDLDHRLVVDDTSVGIIHRPISADHELWGVGDSALVQKATELSIRIDHCGDALGRVKPCNLRDVLASRVVELRHALCMTGIVVDVTIVTRVPLVERLVEAIKPIGSGR
ncbi:hypothetical protein FJTKL_05380 [Diaporthe vaccinii]|uniref:Uncharacterized protein n=1 Tax=Diaporthe vaccinii TaxID=105482 RepID=A0ABR4FFL7_9PEZI